MLNKNFFNFFFGFLAIVASSFIFILFADYYGKVFEGDLAALVISFFIY